MKKFLFKLHISALCLTAGICFAADDEGLVHPLQSHWAEIKYRHHTNQQADAYHSLAEQARKLADSHPTEPGPLIWEGIAISSEAGVKGGLAALSMAKEAKLRFEQAIQLNAQALNGAAYTSLATLYAKVPGWPLGFGNKNKAEELFRKALRVAPGDIDANFFYGDFLSDQGRTAEAVKYLEAALKAEARTGRELADKGRRREAEVLLKKLVP